MASINLTTAVNSGSPISLANVNFSQFGIPPNVKFSVEQKLSMKDMPGNYNRQIDCMGATYGPITFEALFLQQDAKTQALALQTLVESGASQQLIWGTYAMNVIVRHVAYAYQRETQIAYDVTCEVLSVGDAPQAPSTVLQAVNSDVSSSAALPMPTSQANVSAALTDVQTALSGVTSLPSSSSTTTAVLGALQGSQTLAASELATAGASLIGLSIGAEATSTHLINDISSALSLSQGVAALSSFSGFIGRAVTNVTNGGLV